MSTTEHVSDVSHGAIPSPRSDEAQPGGADLGQPIEAAMPDEENKSARPQSPLDRIIARAKVASPAQRRQRKADRAHHDDDLPLPGAIPKVDTPALRLRRLAGVALWALSLVLAGVVSAVVALVQIINGVPAWFQPVFIGTGVAGMLLAMSAFATVRFRGVPWLLLAASTMTLAVALALISFV